MIPDGLSFSVLKNKEESRPPGTFAGCSDTILDQPKALAIAAGSNLFDRIARTGDGRNWRSKSSRPSIANIERGSIGERVPNEQRIGAQCIGYSSRHALTVPKGAL
jgi:hypothetical protein